MAVKVVCIIALCLQSLGCAPPVSSATLVIQHISRGFPHWGTKKLRRRWEEARRKKASSGSSVVILRGDPSKPYDPCTPAERIAPGIYETDGMLSATELPLYRFALLYPPTGAPLKVVYRDLRALSVGPIYVVLEMVSGRPQHVRRARGGISTSFRRCGSPCNGMRN